MKLFFSFSTCPWFFCISNLFLIGYIFQELSIKKSNNYREIYLNIRKVSHGITNLTISPNYLQYPAFIEASGHAEVRQMIFSTPVHQGVIPFY